MVEYFQIDDLLRNGPIDQDDINLTAFPPPDKMAGKSIYAFNKFVKKMIAKSFGSKSGHIFTNGPTSAASEEGDSGGVEDSSSTD